MNKHTIEKEETATSLGAADPVTSDGSQPSLSSCYLGMIVKVDETLFICNLLTSFFTWLLLASYIVFPRAFMSLGNAKALNRLGNVRKIVLTQA
jgi:hypothetical protein